jgi:hypothetical protein
MLFAAAMLVKCQLPFDLYESEVLARQQWFPYLSGKLLVSSSTGEPQRRCTLESTCHAHPLTISLRDDAGDVVQARQVSTRSENIHSIFTKLTRERLWSGESFMAVLEVCGFNDWLIRRLRTGVVGR